MANEIVERLRYNAANLSDFTDDARLMLAAADEIERLRTALAPFAAFAAEDALMAKADDHPAWGFNEVTMTVGDVRVAAAALTEETEADGE